MSYLYYEVQITHNIVIEPYRGYFEYEINIILFQMSLK